MLSVGDLAAPNANLSVGSGATLQLASSGAVAEVDALTLAGTLGGSGELRVRHSLTSTGTLSGSGSLVLEAAGAGTANSGTLDGFTLRNDGSMRMSPRRSGGNQPTTTRPLDAPRSIAERVTSRSTGSMVSEPLRPTMASRTARSGRCTGAARWSGWSGSQDLVHVVVFSGSPGPGAP